ncbi:MAG: glycosyltransferase family 39 protein [Oscillospiraceae bacterium]|nr:glycosyltransferase family 39 protein [Oscillospiraceae bacterium]
MSRAFNVLCALTFLFLLLLCFCRTGVDSVNSFPDETIGLLSDSVCVNLLWLGGVALFAAGLYRTCARLSAAHLRRLAAAVCFFCFAGAVAWILVSGTVPQADQQLVCECASAFNRGDFSSLQRGQYAAIYRQQLGLITLLRGVFLLFGDGNFRAFRLLSALMIPVLVWSGFRITARLSDGDPAAQLLYLLFMVLCVPLYGYAPYVYGEICSTALCMLAVWLLFLCLERCTPLRCAALGGSIGLAVCLRENSLILAIAMLLVLCIKLLSSFSVKRLAAAGAVICGVLLFQLGIPAAYRSVTPADSTSMPAVCWVAMGTHDRGDGWAGWYDASNVKIFAENGFDPAKTSAAAKAELRAYAHSCLEDPAGTAKFYYRKIAGQWCTPMYQCTVMNSKFAEKPSPFVDSVCSGAINKGLVAFMNIHQMLVFAGVLFLLAARFRKWTAVENYLPLICVFGGFLFSILWEGKTRYVFPYFILMIPCAAAGLCALARFLSSLCEKTIRTFRAQRSAK